MKTSIRETNIVIFIVLFLAACTPAATPPVDTGQEDQVPTLTLSLTETVLPTETLTPTATAIPPTPTFPAPEGADLPASAVRSVDEQGQEVILDQPGGDVLWTLTEDESGGLIWQENLSELEPVTTELQKKLEAHLEQQTAESAKNLTTYLNEHVQGDVGLIDYEGELGDFEIGWHVEDQRWRQITEENEHLIDRTLDTSFGPVFVEGRTEDGKDFFTDKEGEEVALERKSMPYIGEVTIAELVLMGRKNELKYDGQTGLDLAEYTSLLMKGANYKDSEDEATTESIINKYSSPFALATVLFESYYASGSEKFTLVDEVNEQIIFPSIPTNDLLYPIVEEHEGEAKVVCWMRVVQGIGRFGYNRQFSIGDSGGQVRYEGAMREKSRGVFGGRTDADDHPWAIFLQPGTQEESMRRTHTPPLFNQGEGIISDEQLAKISRTNPEEIIEILEDVRLAAFYSHQMVVKR